MAGILERPGVEVIQEFTAATPSTILPILPPVIIGEACQIEENEVAGNFDNVTTNYTYPELVTGATVDLTSVVVELVAAEGTFDITADAAVTIGATQVTVAANPAPSKAIKANTQVATITAGDNFTDNNLTDGTNDFRTLGVKVGDTVAFEDAKADLVEVDSKQSLNLGTWTISGVLGRSQLEVIGSTPAHLEGTVLGPYNIQAGVNDGFRVDVDGGGNIDVTLTPGSAQTAADIADDLNGDPTFAAAATADAFNNYVRIRSDTEGSASSLTIGFVSPTANATLGFTNAQTDAGSDGDTLLAETDVEYSISRTGSTSGKIQLSYKACRTDEAAQLFTAQDTATIETLLGKIHPDNPLAYGMSAALSATDLAVHGVIVSDKDSTVSHAKALDFLSSQDVYALVPLSQNAAVRALYPTHVDLYSQPENKKERICILNPAIPSFESFQDESTTGATTIGSKTFTDVNAQFVTNGVPIGAVLRITAIGGTTLEVDSTDRTTELTSPGYVELTIATINSETSVDIIATTGFTTFDPGAMTYTVKSKDWTQTQKATNQAGIAEAINSRRVVNVHPDQAKFSVAGVETTLPAYYICCSIAGMISGLNPAQGFTTLPVPGPTELIGSNDIMSEFDLNTLAGGGVFTVVQEVVGGPITVRHQLTTAVADIKTRELSVVKAVDFSAKYFRNQLRHLIGRYNLTDEFVNNQLRPAAAGVIQDLIEERVIGRTTRITSINILAAKPDTVEVVIEFAALIPVNFIQVRLQI